ncbi:MAG: FtsW/RodA/SpoVE family cell cycle protein, partial [Opitutae bacterium]|nr:FtsW/RodA/SpoVE family cell cycle protein [Opitutae bacterium]
MSASEENKGPVSQNLRFVYSRVDWITPMCLLMLGIISICFIYSAQIYSGGKQWQMQLVWLTAGGFFYLGISSMNYKILLEKGHLVYILGIVALLLVMTPIGFEKYGSRRWIDLGILRVQPTEAAKIGTLILCASILARSKIGTLRESLSPLGKVLVATALPIVLIFLQPDLGSTLVFPPMVFTLLFLAKIPLRFFAIVVAIIVPVLGMITVDMYRFQKHLETTDQTPLQNLHGRNGYEKHSWVPLQDYQRNRILAFVAPDIADPQGIGVNWNRAQS